MLVAYNEAYNSLADPKVGRPPSRANASIFMQQHFWEIIGWCTFPWELAPSGKAWIRHCNFFIKMFCALWIFVVCGNKICYSGNILSVHLLTIQPFFASLTLKPLVFGMNLFRNSQNCTDGKKYINQRDILAHSKIMLYFLSAIRSKLLL